MKLSLGQKAVLLLSIFLLLELAIVGLLGYLLKSAEREAKKEEHAKQVASHTDQLIRVVYEKGSTLKKYLVERDQALLKHFDELTSAELNVTSWLKSNVEEDEKPLMQRVDSTLARGREVLGQARTFIETGPSTEELIDYLSKTNVQLDPILKKVVPDFLNLRKRQERIEAETPQQQRQFRKQTEQLLYAAVAVNVLGAALGALLFMRGITNRISVLTDNTRRLAGNQPLKPRLKGSDELAALDEVFHNMAEALEAAARKERAIVDNALDVICSIDATGKFVSVSPASQKVWGMSHEELLGRRCVDIVVEEDRQRMAASLEGIKGGASIGPFESRVAKADGSSVDTLWTAYWSNTDRTMFCVAHDITERKRAEELLKASEERVRTIIESIPVGLLVVDQAGIIDTVNSMTQQLFAFEKSELVGRHLMKILPQPGITSESAFMESIYPRYVGRVGELSAINKKGEQFPIEFSISEIRLSDGPRLLAIILDVSERHEIQKMRQAFVAMVSHDLRTPLTGVQGFLTLLTMGAMGEVPDTVKIKGEQAQLSVSRLISLVNDLLDLERLESGRLDLVIAPHEVATILERCIDSVAIVAEQNGVDLDIPASDIKVNADGDRIIQVLVNLLGNAIKFSPKGEVVSVSVTIVPGFVEFRVKDQGRGVPEKYRESIFEKFQQVQAEDATQKGGTGLGLAICKAIIVQHGGTIGVESEDGKGSEFWFRIPG